MAELELTSIAPQIRDAIILVEKGQFLAARDIFAEHLERYPDSALAMSYVGLIMVLLKTNRREGLRLCREAVRREPDESLCYLNLAKAQFALGDRKDCVKNLHLGLRLRSGRPDLLMAFFRTIGYRRKPPIPFLHRDNILNKYLGKLTWKLGGRQSHEKAVRKARIRFR